jgi:fido (protein-threonine AMPylation protein)
MPSIMTREQLNAAEARNIALVVQKYLAAKPRRRSAKFDYAWLLRLHQEMFGKVWDWAGHIRATNLNLGVHFSMIGEHLAQLVSDVNYRESRWDMLDQVAHLHHRSVYIHPFRNGNGRWSRMLTNVWLRLHDHPLIQWPSEIGQETSSVRHEYLAAMRAADDGDMEPFMELHRRFCG